MKLTNWLTFVQALLVMAACAYGQDVQYNYDRGKVEKDANLYVGYQINRLGPRAADDPAKKQLIWRGDTTKAIDLKKDPDKNYKNLQKAMAKLFKNYPPHGSK